MTKDDILEIVSGLTEKLKLDSSFDMVILTGNPNDSISKIRVHKDPETNEFYYECTIAPFTNQSKTLRELSEQILINNTEHYDFNSEIVPPARETNESLVTCNVYKYGKNIDSYKLGI